MLLLGNHRGDDISSFQSWSLRSRLFSIALTLAFLLQCNTNAVEARNSTSGSFQTRNSTNFSNLTSNKSNSSYLRPEDMTARSFHLAFIGSFSKGVDKLIGGAFFIALDDLAAEAKKNNKSIPVSFTWTLNDTDNFENRAVRIMTTLYCTANVSAFIGPSGYCSSAGLVATAVDIPYMTYGCHDNYNQTNVLRMINTDPSIVYVSKFITALIDHYEWTSFWLLCGTDLKWEFTAQQLKKHAKRMNLTLNGETKSSDFNGFVPNFSDREGAFKDYIQESKVATRIYVYLGDFNVLMMLLHQMHQDRLMDSKQYVVVAVEAVSDTDHTSQDNFYLSKFNKNRLKSKDTREDLRSVFRNVLVIGPLRQKKQMVEFESRVYNRSLKPPINLRKPPEIPGVKIKRPRMPKSAYHLYDATMIFGRSVMKLMEFPRADPSNASQVIGYMKNRAHTSKQGNKLTIHSNGETEDEYEVRGHTITKDGNLKVLKFLGSFNRTTHKYVEKFPLWKSGEKPKSDPECGFNGEKCVESQPSYWAIAICVAVAIIIVIIVVAFFKKWANNKKLERLLWKIELDKIQFVDNVEDCDTAAVPRTKKKESLVNPMSPLLLSDSPDSFGYSVADNCATLVDQPRIGTYKGCTVFVKKMTRKHLELTRALKKAFQLRKELTHENINRFIGACIDTPHVRLVTEHCSRKSVWDILVSQTLPQEEMFITSLVQDLINGMAFIHDSDLKYHGNLKSTNCLVDRRWTLKIADFGYCAMGPPPPSMVDDEASFKKLLWTAPEFLQKRFTSSSSYSSQNHSSISQTLRLSHPFHQHSNDNASFEHAQQKGDVYSFSIILYELYGQAGPWGKLDLSCKDIIEKLMNPPFYEPFRPDTTSLKCGDPSIINLMHSCWVEKPESRPDFKYAIKQRHKPKQQGSLMELYADSLETLVAERTKQLDEEKKMTENLLHRMLPRPVADRLMRRQPVKPEQFECVTIYFSDIVGFTELSAESTPMEVVNLLNDLYTLFDSVIHKFFVYKVETIGDAYMVVSGLPNSIGDSHAGEIASMSLLFLQNLKESRFAVRGQKDYMLKIRIGIHSGPCCAGVVGLKMPRYCLFGDTVNTANRMESTGEALKIHCSAECKEILDKLDGYQLEKRGHIDVKGKGQLLTYFLVGEDEQVRQKRLISITNVGRCVSTSNLDYTGTPINRRSAPPLTLPPLSPNQNNFRSSSISLPQTRMSFQRTKNSVAPMSLNTSMDSTLSAPLHHDDSMDDSNFFSDPKPTSLPRPVTRQNSLVGKNMSPIAEDPWTPNGIVLKEKRFNYNDVGWGDAESECDTLLKHMPRNSFKRNSNNNPNNIDHSPILSMNNSSHPETVL